MKPITKNLLTIVACLCASLPLSVNAAGDLGTGFSNLGGISNTRHNLTQSTANSLNAGETDPLSVSKTMGAYRNNYNEVCVYCHTPHGANTQVALPLWNRTHLGNEYQTYDTLGTSTLTSAIDQPGLNSLACLSCHDGTLPVDSIINAPGSGGYSAAQQTTSSVTFLNLWNNTVGQDAAQHMSLDGQFDVLPGSGLHLYTGSNNVLGIADGGSCLSCHAPNTLTPGGATSFQVFSIGTDLTNDHPVGVVLPPNGDGTDFNSPTASRPASTATGTGVDWFDLDGDNRPDSNEIRFYSYASAGNVPRVECASCHDPHGVSATVFAGEINPSFLRVRNDGSAVCLTCHVK
jgi:hypothetical protein